MRRAVKRFRKGEIACIMRRSAFPIGLGGEDWVMQAWNFFGFLGFGCFFHLKRLSCVFVRGVFDSKIFSLCQQ